MSDAKSMRSDSILFNFLPGTRLYPEAMPCNTKPHHSQFTLATKLIIANKDQYITVKTNRLFYLIWVVSVALPTSLMTVTTLLI